MPAWKKSIFVNAIKARVQLENRAAEDIIEEYTKLKQKEKKEILDSI